MVYQASRIRRRRATQAEMEERAEFLIDYAARHGPITVRGLYYQAEVAGLPGIDKTEGGYAKVQAQVLKLRQEGRLPYSAIADATRYMRKPRSFDGWEEALQDTARLYRKNLWRDLDIEVEIWIEKSALAGVIYPVTADYDVPLMPTGGFTSETFAYEAVERLRDTCQTLVVYALYDFDRSGQDAAFSLQDKLHRFGEMYDVDIVFNRLALTDDQVRDMALPTRPPKRTSVADQRWPHDVAAELDAIPPDDLREMVQGAIERHLPVDELETLKEIEAEERRTLMDFIGRAA
ncbi:hypothetical protein [Wenxinia marina]|uniref:Uncharacterized protein n=1 Tax=Wenxinia marina DSM 24838 TaxID=1123501 RepID=A0A0D0QEL2_9RHOB|nr:hypothetical protein [Wenxinia marina]KIQ69448.1 hypothetical protein Wenmar_01810 [Wenxinia marina DSM 24838]GGL58458.1 hypothetical protein GCM10011392_11120 [Wenxinia marina]